MLNHDHPCQHVIMKKSCTYKGETAALSGKDNAGEGGYKALTKRYNIENLVVAFDT